MNPLDRASLGATLDALAEALFFHRPLTAAQRTTAARWIARRQGLPGAYAAMFAPTARDAFGVRLFTGEIVHSRVGIAHLLGEEACRILTTLQPKDASVRAALDRAVQGMVERLEETERRGSGTGTYCCGTCSTGYWRNLANHLFPRAEERLSLGLDALQQARRGDGTWHRFPFYHTSLALTEIAPELARPEMRYAAARWRHLLPRLSPTRGPITRRRIAVGQRLLLLCEA